MPDTPWITLSADDPQPTLRLAGAWRMPRLAEIETALNGLRLPAALKVDGSALQQIDSASALVLLRTLAAGGR
ncbi:MAG: hypothetical protein Q8L92_16275, partial [Rubrivivax sp.]|nr:hypothetical protein [Rubrivivax sp.]